MCSGQEGDDGTSTIPPASLADELRDIMLDRTGKSLEFGANTLRYIQAQRQESVNLIHNFVDGLAAGGARPPKTD